MNRSLLLFVLALGCTSSASAQFAGSRAGEHGESTQTFRDTNVLPPLNVDAAQGYIMLDGVAETRVKATEIRIVLAITAEGETAKICRQTVDATSDRLRGSWTELGIPPQKITSDFIAVLPVYEWATRKEAEKAAFAENALVEKRTGFRMQTNLHVIAKSETEAQAVINRAFDQGVTDIIAFDYWSRELDKVKQETRERAVKAALDKATMLLGLAFDNPKPRPINVQEKTVVHYPASLYHSFTNSQEQTLTPRWNDNRPFIAAPRPKNTYYRGLVIDADVRPTEPAMNPEISVVATVRLYYESPSTKPAASARPQR